MAYKNQRKQHAHVRELHRKQGLGRHKIAKTVSTEGKVIYLPNLKPTPSTIFGRISDHVSKLFKF
jgi:hypothetical protein